MNIHLAILLGVYLAGIAIFLLVWRDRCLGGWFQTFFTALSWPILVIFILFKKDMR